MTMPFALVLREQGSGLCGRARVSSLDLQSTAPAMSRASSGPWAGAKRRRTGCVQVTMRRPFKAEHEARRCAFIPALNKQIYIHTYIHTHISVARPIHLGVLFPHHFFRRDQRPYMTTSNSHSQVGHSSSSCYNTYIFAFMCNVCALCHFQTKIQSLIPRPLSGSSGGTQATAATAFFPSLPLSSLSL